MFGKVDGIFTVLDGEGWWVEHGHGVKFWIRGRYRCYFFLSETREKSTVAVLPDNYEKNKSTRGRE